MSEIIRHLWQPASLMRDLIPPIAFNCRLGSGDLARVYPFAGRWHVQAEDGTTRGELSMEAVCTWLGDQGATPLGLVGQ